MYTLYSLVSRTDADIETPYRTFDKSSGRLLDVYAIRVFPETGDCFAVTEVCVCVCDKRRCLVNENANEWLICGETTYFQ